MTEEPEIYDDNDCALGDWSGVVPWKMKRWTEQKLYFAQVQNGGGQYSRLVEAELSRRRNHELKLHIKALKEATDSVKDATAGVENGVSKLATSSAKMESLTSALIAETADVRSQVVVLTASSHNIERLTKWLIGLTIVLGILTMVLAADVVLKYLPEHLQLTAPQTPPLPAPQSRQ